MHRSAIRLPLRLLSQRPLPLRRSSPAWLPPANAPVLSQGRSFANSPALYKKKDKAKKAPAAEPVESKTNAAPSEDPFDLSQLQNGLATAAARLKDDLSKLRAGGRFNTLSLEALKVQLGKEAQSSVKLGDLAQVVPKGGRMVTLLAAEEEVSFFLSRRGFSGLAATHLLLLDCY